MTSEEQDILAKINQLRGQINQHKNERNSDSTPFNFSPQFQQSANAAALNHNTRTPNAPEPYTSSNLGYSRGGYVSPRSYSRGGRRAAPIHRNRTLVLNGNNQPDSTPSPENSGTATPSGAGPGWVVKTDRHLQLINSSVFEKSSQERQKAIEETRLQKQKQRDEREKNKLHRHLQRAAGSAYVPGRPTQFNGNYEVNVQGIRFQVVKNGAKLIKVPGDLNVAKSTPKTALIGGVKFHRSKNGNMYRAGIIKAHRRTAGTKKINEPCKIFATTGSCTKGTRCRYIHDASKVAVCKEFLQKGSCPSGDSCDLSHELTPERTPSCLHFSKGNCSNPNCRYTHVRVSPNAPVCRDFAIYGFCEKGLGCPEKHVYECPDFSNTGTCITKGCKLPHRLKASVMRINNIATGDSTISEDSDISSDEDDEEIDSDDVDSDEFEEFFGDDDDGSADPDISAQKDFVRLR